MVSLPPSSRLTSGLLIAITVLLALMTLGLAVAGVTALRLVPEAMGILKGMKQELVATRQATQELKAEVDRLKAIAADASTQAAARQQTLRTRLDARAKQTNDLLDGIEARRRHVPEKVSANPLAKLDVVIELNKLMADEILILNRHLAQTQEELADAIAPLPIQQKAKGK